MCIGTGGAISSAREFLPAARHIKPADAIVSLPQSFPALQAELTGTTNPQFFAMLARTLVTLSIALLAAAAPQGNDSPCSVGSLQCCQSTETVRAPIE